MKKYVVVKVKVDSNMNITSILDVLFESNSYEKACEMGELYTILFTLKADEYIGVGSMFKHGICLN